MVEYLNLRPSERDSQASVSILDAGERSVDAALRWLDTNQSLAFAIAVALVVGFAIWRLGRRRGQRF